MLILSNCYAQTQPEYQRSISWARSNPWLVADLHTHSNFSDGSLSADELIEEAIKGGCEVVALTDHSDNTRQVTTATTPYFTALARLRNLHPRHIIVGGIEWNIPPYHGREHVNLLVNPQIEDIVLSTFRKQFDSVGESSDKPASPADEETSANAALEWLSSQITLQNQAVLFYNHPSRKVSMVEESGKDLQQWRRSINGLMIGFEGGPGHQHADITGSYNQQFQTEDRWDPVVAETGGVWDGLLDQGEDIWAAMANSDFHNRKLDYLPCVFSRTHIQVPEMSVSGVLKGLQAGSFWADHGRILNKLVFTVNTPGLDSAATPGEIIKIDLGKPISINLDIERDQGADNAPLIAELVSNCANGKPDLIGTKQIAVAQNTASWVIEKTHMGGDGESCYLRVRVRKQNAVEADLLAYSNPVRIMFQQLGGYETMLKKHFPTEGSMTSENSSNFNLALGQSQGVSPILLGIIVLMLFILIIVALIYFNKFRFKTQHNNVMGDSESIRYDSLISLCALVFDQLNSVLYISHGRKLSQINFAEICGFEVIANTNCVLKIDRNSTLVFGNETEENLRSVLDEVDKEELLENETRQLTFNIFYELEDEIKPALVNFYYREGTHRLSPNSFASSVDDVVLWCDLLESAIRPTLDEELDNTETYATDSLNIPSKQDETESLNVSNQTESELKSDSTATQAILNNNLGDQLTKLADLKDRGILSDAEFQKIKNRIINF